MHCQFMQYKSSKRLLVASWARRALALGVLGLSAVSLNGCSKRVDAGPQANIERATEIRKTLLASSGGSESDSGDGAAADSGEAAGWATLTGKFTLVGAPPKPAQIDANKDPEVCGKHKLFNESLEASSDGALRNVAIWLRTPKVPVNPEYAADKGREVVLDNKDCRFEPHVLVLRTDEKLVIRNSDPVGHNSKGDPAVNSGFNPIIPAGQQFDTAFGKEESLPVPVGCNIHPWMSAWIVVRNDPYAAVSSKDGDFTIKDLPAGRELEFQLWQERVGFIKDATAEGVKVDGKGRFKLKLTPGEDKKLEFKVSLK